MASLAPNIAGLLARSGSSGTGTGIGLPDGEDVALGIAELREPAHPGHRLFCHEDLGPKVFRLVHELVYITHVDVVDRHLTGVHAAHESTVDTGPRRHALVTGGNGLDHPVLHAA